MNGKNWHQLVSDLSINVSNFINGEYVKREPVADNIAKYSSRDGQLLYKINAGEQADVDFAVSNAKDAQLDGRWSGLPVDERKTVLKKLADLIELHTQELALYESLDVGKPISKALKEDIPGAAALIRYSAEGADKLLSPFGANGTQLICHVRRPIGVVAGIVGWNYPLTLAATKVGPALAMGNSLVLKPSEFSPLSACRLAELALEAGVPPGVFNVVLGSGAIVGDTLARHIDVDLMTFTGSSATGKQIMVAAGQSNMKRLILECGGKSAYLVFDDCPQDLDFIASDILAKAFANQGALCVAGTRLLIQQSIKDKLLPKILEQVSKITPQDPLDPDTTFGALINEEHMNKVLSYIDSGVKEGATLLYGGRQVNGKSGGYYIEPTIFDDVNQQQKIAQEEIFGPVLSIFSFKDENEAIEIANDSRFGLAAYAATENVSRATKLAQRLDAGIVEIIGSSSFSEDDEALMSVEPHKESGFGTEGGLAGLAAYTKSTGVQIFT